MISVSGRRRFLPGNRCAFRLPNLIAAKLWKYIATKHPPFRVFIHDKLKTKNLNACYEPGHALHSLPAYSIGSAHPALGRRWVAYCTKYGAYAAPAQRLPSAGYTC